MKKASCITCMVCDFNVKPDKGERVYMLGDNDVLEIPSHYFIVENEKAAWLAKSQGE